MSKLKFEELPDSATEPEKIIGIMVKNGMVDFITCIQFNCFFIHVYY